MKKQIVKRFTQFINEGDNPVHNLVRTAHNRMTGKHTEPVDFESEFNKLTDDDKDHFKKIVLYTDTLGASLLKFLQFLLFLHTHQIILLVRVQFVCMGHTILPKNQQQLV
mgnify:CR=1 FL=1